MSGHKTGDTDACRPLGVVCAVVAQAVHAVRAFGGSGNNGVYGVARDDPEVKLAC